MTVLVTTLLAAAIAAGVAGAASQVGYTAEPFSSFKAESGGGAVTGQKPESKLWYQDGKWWGSMISNAQGGKHTIHRLDGVTWTDTGVVVDSRVTAREDALLAAGKLYILVRAASGTGSSKLTRFTYAGGAYTMDAGFPVDVAGGGSETETLARDSTGKLWLTYTSGNSVYVSHTTSSDTTWRSAYVVSTATGLTSDDISAIISFDDGNGPAIGVIWSNQSDNKQHFAVHRDSAADTTWTQETALSGNNEADDHINLKTYAGRVFAVVKTSQDDAGASTSTPLIKLLVRAKSGTWTAYRVATLSEDNTRPITLLEIDPADQKIYVFLTLGVGPTAHGIAYKQTSATNINFPSSATIFIQGASNEVINDATSTKQNLDDTTGVVVMASDGKQYWWNRISPGGAGGNTTPTATAGSSSTTHDVPVTVTLRGSDSDPSDCELTFTIATQPAHGTLGSITNQACQAGSPNNDTATVQYTPAAGYAGPDSFSFQVSDGTAGATATVSMTVNSTPPPAGSIAFRGSSAAGNATATSLTIPVPGGAQAGDVELASVTVRGSPAITAPVGWTLVRSDQSGFTIKQAVYWHLVGSSEPADYTWTWSPAQGASGGIAAYSGVDNTNPIDVSSGQTGTGTTITAPAVTTSVAGDMLAGFFGTSAAAGFTAPATMSERFDVVSSAGTYRTASEGTDEWRSAAGSTGSRSATASLSAAAVGQLVALRPGSGGPPPPPPPPPPPGNTAPTANAGSATTTKGTAVTATLRGSDADASNCELTFTIATQPAHGTLGAITNQACQASSPNNDTATVSYTPAAGYTGADSFSFQVSDGTASATAVISITINDTPPPPGSLAFHGASSAGNATATSLTIPAPAGAQSGDVELASVTVRGSPAITAPVGWTLVRSDQSGFTIKQAVYWHLVGSSEPADYTWTWSPAQGASGGIAAYGGVNTTTPIDASSGQTGSGTAITAPTVTTTVAGTMLVGFFGTSAPATATPPSGMSERFDVFSSAGTYRAASEGADQTLSAAGASGSRTATASLSAANIGQLVALKPA